MKLFTINGDYIKAFGRLKMGQNVVLLYIHWLNSVYISGPYNH